MIEIKFGPRVREHIQRITGTKLKRKIIETVNGSESVKNNNGAAGRP